MCKLTATCSARTKGMKVMVNEWMISGLLSIIAVTTTLGAFGTYVNDLEAKKNVDLLTTELPHASIQFKLFDELEHHLFVKRNK